MKKLIMALALIATTVVGYAQTSLLSEYGLALDTVTNTGTVTLSGRVTGAGLLSVQVVVDELSGTTAGTLTLMGSLDNVTYTAIDTLEHAPADQADAQSFVWMQENSHFPYYAVRYVGSGTMAATISAKAIVRRRQ